MLVADGLFVAIEVAVLLKDTCGLPVDVGEPFEDGDGDRVPVEERVTELLDEIVRVAVSVAI